MRHALLTPDEMSCADQAAITSGVPGVKLMEAAGAAVVEAILARWDPRPVAVLCGPGNNGGDGFVVARRLQKCGWPVRLALSVDLQTLKGDAAFHAQQWQGEVLPLEPRVLDGVGLVVDALFGAGLSRDVDGPVAALLDETLRRRLPVCAVDVPSGVDGATGAVRGTAVAADLTVTFFRKKPGHLLMPGKELCGELVLADIGIPDDVLSGISPSVFENHPECWASELKWPDGTSHKYLRGHVVVSGSASMPGAAKLAAMAAARVGAGLVTLAVPKQAWPVYAASMMSIMVQPLDGDIQPALEDARRNAILLGPGAGAGEATRRNVLLSAGTGRPLVLDADALSAFERQPELLFRAISGPCVVTPHEGEFARLFQCPGDKLTRARQAARQSGTVVVLKGADTVIAEPGGRAAINANASPWLATGGTGDVLAGMVAGLLAQGVPAFPAACAAVWMHAAAARLGGPGLISEDLPGLLPQVLRQLAPVQ